MYPYSMLIAFPNIFSNNKLEERKIWKNEEHNEWI